MCQEPTNQDQTVDPTQDDALTPQEETDLEEIEKILEGDADGDESDDDQDDDLA